MVWGKILKSMNVHVFNYFALVSPYRKVLIFIWTNWNFLHPRMSCLKFGWNLPKGFRKKIFKFWQCTYYYFVIFSPRRKMLLLNWINLGIFCLIFWLKYLPRKSWNLPLKKGVAYDLNNPQYLPSKDALCQLWLKLAVWRKHIYRKADDGHHLYLSSKQVMTNWK